MKMKSKLLIFLAVIGLAGLFTSCEEDLEIITMSDVTAPELISVPNLELLRDKATDTLEFIGTAVDPGFTASATYILEAAAAGSDFADPVSIYSGSQCTSIKLTVSDINSLLLSKFTEDQTSSADFRIRAQLNVEAGTGAPGTGSDPFEYSSTTTTADITIFGLPKLDLLDSGIDQKIQSKNGDGVYSGYVSLDATMAFTLYNSDNTTTYGGTGDVLSADGDALVPPATGWNKLIVNLNDMSYVLEQFSPGVVGAFTDWSGLPDKVMDWDIKANHWTITLDLPTGPMKFRLNSDWGTNWGQGVDGDIDLPANGVVDLPNSTGNINITEAGNYTINATFDGGSGKATFIKN